ncbi:hypothetical protein FB567DRAFT_48224 [Paraphoma chrysanthemicola]|uniref:Uncharacterized protein n=1 Tax=Paraphoma chrysanthemicola TaxID=798071 RepID=A0A8K0RLL2_9PLEO|nr:hypothetical protein FB567DRAFT_48224 [Paraphoma chrysanthemicola]
MSETSSPSLSSSSAYAALIALLPAFLALGFTERGWNLLTGASRKARTTVLPSDGRCEIKLWSDFPSGPLHFCSSPSAPSLCHQRPHVRGPQCWEQTLFTVMNTRIRGSAPTYEEKPTALPLPKGFIRVDFTVLFAFILMTGHRSLDVQTIAPDLLVLHSSSSLQRFLTKDDVDRILAGDPPFINNPAGITMPSASDVRRGGWVAALGLETNYKEEETFMPYYHDCIKYVDQEHGDKRGRVFWRSMDRVRCIVVEVVAAAFAQDATAMRDIKIAIKALDFIRKHETESGIEHFFDIPRPNQALQPQEKEKIVGLFNGSPLIAESRKASFYSEWKELLHWVLIAAVIGSERCIRYFKSPDRELDLILPMESLRTSRLYIRGC